MTVNKQLSYDVLHSNGTPSVNNFKPQKKKKKINFFLASKNS